MNPRKSFGIEEILFLVGADWAHGCNQGPDFFTLSNSGLAAKFLHSFGSFSVEPSPPS